MKFSKRFRIARAGLWVAASWSPRARAASIRSKSTAAPTASRVTTAERARAFAPTAAQKALIGVTDGTYRVTFNPQRSQVILARSEPARRSRPTRSATMGTSGYGPSFWDAPCTPQTSPVQLTVTVRERRATTRRWTSSRRCGSTRRRSSRSTSTSPGSPSRTRRTGSSRTARRRRRAARVRRLGSGKAAKCVNEALTDPDLHTFVDYDREHAVPSAQALQPVPGR